MHRINVMHFLWGLGAAGMENGIINICHGLARDCFSPSICTFTPGEAAEQRVDEGRVQLYHLRKRFGNDPTLPVRLAWLLRRRKIDVLHTHGWGTLIEGIVAARLASVPAVVHGEHGKIADRRRQIVAQRWGWRRVDRILAVSSALADRMSHIIDFPRSRIQVIPNGVDAERFQPSATPKCEFRRQLGLPASGLLIGMVARFVPFKDHAGVLHAVARLRGTTSEAHLALAGDGPLGDELRQLANKLDIADNVHFLGELSRVESLLYALDVLVSNSSHNEGMSNAMLEAMACGVPVVATRVAASPELLDEGNAGLLIAPRDTEALARALQQLIEKPKLRQSLSQLGRERIEAHYDITSMVESYGRLYLQLAGASGATCDGARTLVQAAERGKCSAT